MPAAETLGLQEIRCRRPECRNLLARARLEGNSLVEIKCRRCSAITSASPENNRKRVKPDGHGGDSAAAYHGDKAVIGSDGSTLFSSSQAGVAIADAGLRKVIQTLDDADVPMEDRFLVVPPVEKKNLTGIARFTEQAFTGEVAGGNTIRNGLIGDLYGIPVYVSTNSPTNNSARACLLAHRSAMVLAEQQSVRYQTQ